MKVLILGLGYTGRRLGQRLIHQGVTVIGTNRTGREDPNLSIPIFKFEDPFSAEASFQFWRKLADVTHIISTIAPTPDGHDPVWPLLQQHPHPQTLDWVGYLSTTGVYGDTGGAWVDELSPLQPGTARSQARVNIEQQWLSSDYPAHVFRLPGIYGPHRSIFERLQAGTAQHVIKPGHVFSRVHVDDIAQSLEQSMKNPSPGEVYNVVDDEPCEPRILLLEGARLLNIEPPPPIQFKEAQFSPMGRSFWAECRRVSNQKIKEKLGVKLLYPSYREGLRAILAER